MCGRATHPSQKMLSYARRILIDEREAEQHEWTETKMLEHIDALQQEIAVKRKELAAAQKHLLAHRRRRTA